MTPKVNVTLGLDELTKPVGSLLSVFLNVLPGISRLKTKNAVDDAYAKAQARFVDEKTHELLQKAWDSGLPLPQGVSRLSEQLDTLRLEELSAKITKDKIRQETRDEVQKQFIAQLHAQLIIAFNEGDYNAALMFIGILQSYLTKDSEIYIILENIRILSLTEVILLKSIPDKQRVYYDQLSSYVENNFASCDFLTIFKYGLANLYMLPVTEKTEQFLIIERAKKSFEKALTCQQDIDFTLNNLAVALQYSELYATSQNDGVAILKEAISYLEQAKEIAPQNHKIFSNLGDIYVRLAEISLGDDTQQVNFLNLAVQAYSECLGLTRSFPLVMNRADALFALGKMEKIVQNRDKLFQSAISSYNDACIIAPSRNEAAYACLKMGQVYTAGRAIEILPQEQKDNLIFLGLRCYMTALEHAPFYAELQYETAKLILNIAKFGQQDIPSFERLVQPQVQMVNPSGQKVQIQGRSKQAARQARQAADRAMLSVKINLLESSNRYFRDAIYLMPENPQAIITYGEADVYWAFLQKKQGNQEKANTELNLITKQLDKADQLKPYSASYVRACLHAVQGDAQSCQDKLKDAVQHAVCPPRGQIAREPYFSGYANTSWFKEILRTIPEQPVVDLYSTVAPVFSRSGAEA